MKHRVLVGSPLKQCGLALGVLAFSGLLTSCQKPATAPVAPTVMQNYNQSMKAGGLHPAGAILPPGQGGRSMAPAGLGSSAPVTTTAPK